MSISVIIPTYNREKTILNCLKSIHSQTLIPNEIILIDDFSIDNTINLVKEFDSTLIKIIRNTVNMGAQATRNTGIKAAQGEWIAFQDSDDEWLPTYLEEQMEVAKTKNKDIIYSGAYIFDGTNKKQYQMPDVSHETYKKLLKKPGPMFQGLFVKKKLLNRIGFLDENVPAYQEWETSIRMAKVQDFEFNNKPLFVYHLHEGDTISKNKKRDADGYTYIVNKHKNEIVKFAGMNAYKNHLMIICKKHYTARQFMEWRKYHIERLKISGTRWKNVILHRLIILFHPHYYQRWYEHLSLEFIIKRWYYKLFIKK